jgi:hypothetical protein
VTTPWAHQGNLPFPRHLGVPARHDAWEILKTLTFTVNAVEEPVEAAAPACLADCVPDRINITDFTGLRRRRHLYLDCGNVEPGTLPRLEAGGYD